MFSYENGHLGGIPHFETYADYDSSALGWSSVSVMILCQHSYDSLLITIIIIITFVIVILICD